MASSLTHVRRFHVFPSFHGPDVRKGFLSHLHNHFASKGIRTFKDQEIERGHTIGPELVQAIRESRVSIVLLSKKYASSSWCLDELVEIFKCKEAFGQIVMTIFYEVDPSDVRKQRGDFGSAFEKTCQGKTEEVKQSWTKALTDAANIEGEHSLNWASEAEMIQKIITDVSKKLNVTPSRDFEGMVGMQAHLRKLNSLLCLQSDEVKMIGIWGPAGIGKTTIARALYNQLASSFELECFMGDLKGSGRITGVDDYDSKLSLQNQLLSMVLNQNNLKIHHLGAIKEWLQDQRVLIILDDVDDLEQLEVLAKELSWFGSRSRIIITTEDIKILKAHGIYDIYHVDFPSKKDALEILRLSAFKKSSPWDGFEELAKKVVKLCANLPLGLCVMGSSLRGESKHEWELQLSRIETSLDRKIEDILRLGYDRLLIKDQSLFRHIACFFNNTNVDHVATVLADSNLDVGNGMKALIDKCLVHISTDGQIVMHHLLQKLGRQVVLEQSDEPGKRQFLVEAEDIRDVLENETGTGSVIGISFNMSTIDELSISKEAFKGMRNLQFLRIYRSGKVTMWIPKDMNYLPRLRLLHWDSYPRKCLPPTFHPERLVELHMPDSNLEKLWGGIQPLTRLKKINLGYSRKLIEIPNLLKATNLETLTLTSCTSLEELPSSISNLHKLKKLTMWGCEKLLVLPTNINLASLEEVDMKYCSSLRSFPDISSNIKSLRVDETKIEKIPSSVVGSWSHLERLIMDGISLKRITDVPKSVRKLDLSNSDIKMIPNWVIGLPHLETLTVENCVKLLSIPSLSPLLKTLNASNCVSLEKVCCSFHNPIRKLTFYNCLKLDEEARKGIMQQLGYKFVCVPGKEVPTEFTHKATGNSITISLGSSFSASSRFKACLVLSPIKGFPVVDITCQLRSKGSGAMNNIHSFTWLSSNLSAESQSEHLFIFGGDLFHQQNRSDEVDVTMNEVLFEFTYWDNEDKIIECGVEILTEEAEGGSVSRVGYSETGGNNNHHNSNEAVHTGRWIWSGEEDRTSIIRLGMVIVLYIFLIIQIFGEIRVSAPPV